MINISNIAETRSLARKLATIVNKPTIITLKGDLGSGKTTFTQFFIKSKLTYNVEIISPTFNLIQIYEWVIPIVHCDFYRLKKLEEVYDLGVEEHFQSSIIIVEWPEVAEEFLPENKIEINICHKAQKKREISIEFKGQSAELKNLFDVSE